MVLRPELARTSPAEEKMKILRSKSALCGGFGSNFRLWRQQYSLVETTGIACMCIA